MVNRLEPLNLADFTGGLDLRSNQFQLAPNQSPEMENIVIDPLGGIYSRKGWSRWNVDDVVDTDTTWDPRRALMVQLSDGTDLIYIANDNDLLVAAADGVFTQLAGVVCEAVPHMADFAVFGDDVYVACGREHPMARRRGTTTPATLLTAVGAANFNDDYLNPVHGVAPKAELCEAHAGYLFVANTDEDSLDHPNRIRWSHPTSQDDWAELDFMDIEIGGSQITALISYEDHLLIFKRDSIWALYGYDLDSWQLIQKSSTAGTLSPQTVSRNEAAVFLFSGSDKGAMFAYGGERAVEIGVQIRRAFEQMIDVDYLWVGWLGRKLWVTVPWVFETGATEDVASVFVFDPSVGEGAWTYFTAANARLGPLVGGSNIDSQIAPMGVLRDRPIIMRLDYLDLTADRVSDLAILGTSGPAAILVTGNDEEILAGGQGGNEGFVTKYRTPWITADWPTRKKSWRRADYICRISERGYDLGVESFRDYEERNVARRHTVNVPPSGAGATWGLFTWGDGTVWGAGGPKRGGLIRRGSSQGMCRALQLRVTGTPLEPGEFPPWGVDAIILKVVLRRFR